MNPEIKKEIDELNGLIDKVNGWQLEAQLASLMVDKWPELKMTYSIASQIGQLKGVLIQCYPKTAEDMEPVIEFVNDCGKKCKGTDEYHELQRKTWDYGNIKLSAFFDSREKGACKYVKVGTKEEPVYELKCTDDDNGGGDVPTPSTPPTPQPEKTDKLPF